MFQDKKGGNPVKKRKNLPENLAGNRTARRIRAKNMSIKGGGGISNGKGDQNKGREKVEGKSCLLQFNTTGKRVFFHCNEHVSIGIQVMFIKSIVCVSHCRVFPLMFLINVLCSSINTTPYIVFKYFSLSGFWPPQLVPSMGILHQAVGSKVFFWEKYGEPIPKWTHPFFSSELLRRVCSQR